MRHIKVYSGLVVAVALLGLPLPALPQQTTTPPTPPITPVPVVPAAPAPAPPAPVAPAPAAPAASEPVQPDAAPGASDAGDAEDMSIGDVPVVQTEELTIDKARKALDAYVLVQTKYQDSPLETYDDLQSFVDKDTRGKEFETDIKTFGFASVNDWNLAITTLSFAYTNVLDDQTSDIKQQIEELKASTEMAQDIKDRMINSLNAMIPSANNTQVVNDLIADPVYGDKIKLLETTEE